ncbi:hypothetical protein SAMN04515671_1081 [Nakamurella panacisegetis]|uniref:Uncharacterized protein n=1 Tax=Nakamurella panacisegetis TaxID=1090615 RepID=A0A1H0JXA1_9ACTN|nr:hypothetical protein [Nakamurella panacisegetis]SDO48264.1 hypothetical protein SAMN04515671_1081 [Nakamurella panacisegetis]
MTTTSTSTAAVSGSIPARPRRFLISLWSIPVLVIGQFAMLAVIPVVIVLLGVLRDARLRAVRSWTIALGAAYATPLVIWLVRPDGAKSLSKDMSPVFVVLIAALTAIVLIRMRVKKV